MITADDGRFYSKPMLSNAYKSGKTADQLANAPAGDMAKQLNAAIRVHTRVTAIDTATRHVVLEEERIAYGRLVLALGADPIRLPIEGDGAADVLSVNDLADYTRLRERLRPNACVVILGAGLIGCEFANDLRIAGFDVEVVDLAPHPLGRLLPPKAAASLRAGLEAIGVRFHFGTSCIEVARQGNLYRARLDNGEVLSADLVLSAVGLRPRTALASAAGLTVNRGIKTNRLLQTSQRDIYALGDCAEVEHLNLPFVLPIMHAARALAKTLSGTDTPVSYPAMPVVVKTFSHPAVVSPPPAGAEGTWEEMVEGGSVKALFRSTQGALLGFALTGNAVTERQALTKQLPPLLPAN
jgi:rubredoxin-NAD+ reductase